MGLESAMKVELVGFADELDVGWEKKRVRDEILSFGISLLTSYVQVHESPK